MKLPLLLLAMILSCAACQPRQCVSGHEIVIHYPAYSDEDGRYHDAYDAHRYQCDVYAQ